MCQLKVSDLHQRDSKGAKDSATLDCSEPCVPTPSSDKPWLLNRLQLPHWARASYIIYGYRPIYPSAFYCLETVFALHNETGNIWTHLIGALFFVLLYFSVLTDKLTERMHLADYVLLHMYFFGIIACLSLSTVFHTVSCHSLRASKFFSKLDYVGITLLIVCSFVPWMYYAWFNSPLWRALYIGLAIFFAIGCIIASLCDRFGERHYQKYRAALFLGDGLSGVIPAIHWVSREIFNRQSAFLQENHWPGILVAIMGGTYTIGGLVYMFKLPERLSPGSFDLWFHSHQIFHMLVVLAALLYYHSILQIMQLRLTEPDHFFN